jgi:hypothetical protein
LGGQGNDNIVGDNNSLFGNVGGREETTSSKAAPATTASLLTTVAQAAS